MSEVPPSEPPRRLSWQFGLGTLFLAIAAIAVWMTDLANHLAIKRLRAKINIMLPMTRELVLTDPTRISVVKRQELWYDDNQWDLYLPSGSYRLCLALRNIDKTGFPPRSESVPISPGKHHLVLEQSIDNGTRRASVLLDDSEALNIEEPDTTDHSGAEGGGHFARSEQRPPDRPLILYHCRYMRKDKTRFITTPPGPTDGLMLWIEPGTNP